MSCPSSANGQQIPGHSSLSSPASGPKSRPKSSSPSTGANVGIAIAAAAIVGVGAGMLVCFCLKQRKAKERERSSKNVSGRLENAHRRELGRPKHGDDILNGRQLDSEQVFEAPNIHNPQELEAKHVPREWE